MSRAFVRVIRQTHDVDAHTSKTGKALLSFQPIFIWSAQPARLTQNKHGSCLNVPFDNLGPETFRQDQILGHAVACAPKTNAVGTGVGNSVQVLKAACSVLFDEQAHSREDGGVLGSADAAASG